MATEFGRIGGQMLKSDLVRLGNDLAFETDLLYLNVTDNRIGINTDSPNRDFEINNNVLSTNLIVDTQQKVGNLIISGNTISSVFGPIYINATGPDSFFNLASLETNDLRFTNNTINTFDNTNIELRPHGTGKTTVGTDLSPAILNITGNLHSTGNITSDGNIIFGSDSDDSIVFNADIASNILPDGAGYSLGTDDIRWSSIETILVNGTELTSDSITAGSESINLVLRPGKTFFVSKSGNDTNSGTHQTNTFLTIAKALSVASVDDTVYVYPGTYEEILPLVVPVGVTVKGHNLRNVKILPAAGYTSNDVFLLNGETTIEDLTIAGHRYNSVSNEGYAFRFASNFTVTTRSPYVKNISVLTTGSVTSEEDPLGFAQNDAGRGAYIDGSVANAASNQASMLFHAVTFITPGADSVIMTNGVRVEWLNSFIYYANRGLYAINGTEGFANAGIKFGAEVRSIGSANVYGNFGCVADGPNTLMYLISHNFGYIGTGKNNKNDKELVIQENETVELNSGQIHYVTQDQGGDFRVGNSFYVDFKSGSTSISVDDLGVIGLSSLTFRSGDDITVITASDIDTGNINISQDTIRSLIGDLNFDSASNLINLTTTTSVAGNLTVTGNVSVGGQVIIGDQPLDTAAIVGKISSNINPNISSAYNLGSEFNKWGNIYLSKLHLDDIQITGGVVRTTTSNSDLELISNGTGQILIPESDVIITQDLEVEQDSYLQDLSIQGTTVITGDVTLTGQILQIGDREITGTLTVDNVSQLNNVEINTNFISSIQDDNDLVFAAAGTGTIIIDPATEIDNNITVTGSINVPNVVVIANAGGDIITTDFIKIQDNVIATLNANDNLELQANGNGRILVPSNNVQLNGTLTVVGATDIKSLNIQGSVLQFGDISLTGDKVQVGSVDMSSGLTIDDSGTFGNIKFTTNWIGTTEGNLDLRASGTGIVSIPSNNVLINQDIYAGDTTFSSVSIVDGVSASIVTNTDLTLTTNYITTNTVDADLIIQAAGSGLIYSTDNSWIIENNLTVENQSLLGGLTINDQYNLIGNTSQIGNLTQTGSTEISKNLSVTAAVELGNIIFRTNVVTTSVGDLDLRASGTGIINIPSNNVTVNTGIFATTTNFSSIDVSRSVTAANLTDGTLLMAGNYITTVAENNNFILQANSAGKIYFSDTDAVFDNNLTVALLTSLKNTVIQGTLTQTGNNTQIGNLTRYGVTTLLGKFENNNIAQFENIQINTNFLTTTVTNSDLELRAAGIGNILIPSNNIEINNNLTVNGLPTFSSLTLSRNLNADQFSKGDILIKDNFITTTNDNKNLDLRGVGTGGVFFEEILFTPLNEIRTTAANRNIEFQTSASGNFIIDKTSALKVPVGTTAQRTSLGQADIRFNSSVSYFEGFSTAKRTFGGLFSEDRRTYIKQEPVAELGTIRFNVNGVESMRAANNKLTMNGLTVDNTVNLNLNIISTLSANSDLSLVPNGSGKVQLSSTLDLIGNEFTNTASSATPILFSSTGNGYFKFEGTAGVVIPVGDSASRSFVEVGDTRWNTDLETVEIYDGVQYVSAGGVGGITESVMEDLSNIYSIILG